MNRAQILTEIKNRTLILQKELKATTEKKEKKDIESRIKSNKEAYSNMCWYGWIKSSVNYDFMYPDEEWSTPWQ